MPTPIIENRVKKMTIDFVKGLPTVVLVVGIGVGSREGEGKGRNASVLRR